MATHGHEMQLELSVYKVITIHGNCCQMYQDQDLTLTISVRTQSYVEKMLWAALGWSGLGLWAKFQR